jgi:hypothetical protein
MLYVIYMEEKQRVGVFDNQVPSRNKAAEATKWIISTYLNGIDCVCVCVCVCVCTGTSLSASFAKKRRDYFIVLMEPYLTRIEKVLQRLAVSRAVLARK